MDFDFALVLVVLTFVAALGWVYDRVLLAGPRKLRIAAAEQQVNGSLPESALEELNKENGPVDLCRSLFPVLLVVLVLRSFVVEPFQIPSGSMKPTLEVGDFILVNKWHYGFRLPVLGTKVIPMNDPQRGDVVVFKYPKDPRVNYIKRVVGLPGDRVGYQNKTIFINGKPQTQTLLAQLPPQKPQLLLTEEQLGDVSHQLYRDVSPPRIDAEWVVPEGHYFVMGDNRDNSNDSRFWGYVPDELLVGKAFAVWMHWPEFFTLPAFSDVRTIH
ncbi:signal peptidase I [Amphritea japonica]|uniref:Signal peptidase I n=1 Tax=Amphritea japonica ATCC BAA-1530 TaxID=1278309 RepID=A0A7R6P7H9_9GAMM|nr:signal peptidase I [Amphritea japonica]BBB27369.1 signal peptidase I [Amphritea japonica ATCC BAA-1530]